MLAVVSKKQQMLHLLREVLTKSQTFCSSVRKYTVCSVVQEAHLDEIYAAISTNFIKTDFFLTIKIPSDTS